MKRTSVKRLGLLVMLALVAALVTAVPVLAQSTGTVSGVVYSDTNGNGVREAGENGVQGVQLTISGATSQTVTTAADGSFSVSLTPGTYTVEVTLVPAGFFPIENGSSQVTVNAGGSVSNIEFSIVPRPSAQAGTTSTQGTTQTTDQTTNTAGEVLPASGGIVSGPVIVGGLALVLVLGIGLVIAGQRRSRGDS